MYAIIETGGKQFKVEKGSKIKVEKLAAEVGGEVVFDALMTASGKTVQVGKPVLKDVTVKGKVLAQGKAKKVVVFKYKAKKDYRKKQGHRQPYTEVEITEIVAGKAEKPAEAKAEKPAEAKAEKKPAEKKPAAKKSAEAAVEKKPAEKKAEKKPAEKKPAEKKPAEAKTEKKPEESKE
ncbi:MAG: 50S ribosomal protein L21 [Christensenellaceae bacterium]|jgi:large subunit ribosomal protein L21